jgi:hypothetical protein
MEAKVRVGPKRCRPAINPALIVLNKAWALVLFSLALVLYNARVAPGENSEQHCADTWRQGDRGFWSNNKRAPLARVQVHSIPPSPSATAFSLQAGSLALSSLF